MGDDVTRFLIGVAPQRTRVRVGFRFGTEPGCRAPTIMGVCEELEIRVGVHASNGSQSERARKTRCLEPPLLQRGEDAIRTLGDLGRFDALPAVEKRDAGMVSAVCVGRDREHAPKAVARKLESVAFRVVAPVVVRVYRAQSPDGADAKPIAAVAARAVLASALGIEPGAVEISRRCAHCDDTEHGKPFVVGAPDLSFSVSHSGAFALVALAESAVVGIDAETLRPRSQLDRLAARVLDTDTLAAWAKAPAAEQLTQFLRAWTAKEAYLKAVGLGIATNLRDVTAPPGWTMQALDDLPSYIATVAVDQAARVETTDWEPVS
jgi:phosphopantetheinyl transferase